MNLVILSRGQSLGLALKVTYSELVQESKESSKGKLSKKNELIRHYPFT